MKGLIMWFKKFSVMKGLSSIFLDFQKPRPHYSESTYKQHSEHNLLLQTKHFVALKETKRKTALVHLGSIASLWKQRFSYLLWTHISNPTYIATSQVFYSDCYSKDMSFFKHILKEGKYKNSWAEVYLRSIFIGTENKIHNNKNVRPTAVFLLWLTSTYHKLIDISVRTDVTSQHPSFYISLWENKSDSLASATKTVFSWFPTCHTK